MSPGPFGRFASLAGALPFVVLYPVYLVCSIVYSQIGLPRTVGLLGVLGLAIAAVAAVLFWIPARGRFATAVRAGFALAVFGNLAAVGLAVFFRAPGLAPLWAKAFAGVFVAALMFRLLQQSTDVQRMLVGGLTRLGAVMVAVAIGMGAVGYGVAASRMDTLQRAAVPHAAGPTRAQPPQRIVLVSLDAYRARSAPYDLSEAPWSGFAELARHSTVFDNSRAAGEHTLVSMTTVLTGVRPHQVFPHVHNPMGYVQEGALPGLAGHLAAAGYRSRYVTMKIAPSLLGVGDEFVEGQRHDTFLPANQFNVAAVLPVFEVVDWLGDRLLRRPGESPGLANEILATRESFRQAKAYLDAESGRSFVWVHIGAPHLPYYDVPREDLGGTLRPEAYPRLKYWDVVGVPAEKLPGVDAVFERYSRFVDAELGRFVRQLQQDPQWADTLLVVLSDHGEEHRVGVLPHGNGTLAEDVVHVPLVVHRPRQAAPERVNTLVGHEDVLPTILGQVYLQPVAGLVGRDLLNAPATPRTLYSWGRYGHFVGEAVPGDEIAAYDGRYKFVKDFKHAREALYDLRSDPEAERDVAAKLPEVAKAFRVRMSRDMGETNGPRQ